MSERLTHPPEEALLGFADAELPAQEAKRVREHVGGCPECRARLAGIEAVLRDHARLHHREKASLPPPRPWDDIRVRLAEAEAHRGRRLLGMPPRAWLAVAAALLICVAVVRRFEQPQQVSASELLEKASLAASDRPPRAERRIRITVGGRALLHSATGETELRALFASAGFSWEDPLSVESFAAWRSRLPEKHDEVTVQPAVYLIRTSTPHGVLAAATLSLRSADLQPVRETLEFRNRELVEIWEAPEAPLPPVAAAPPPSAAPAPKPPESAVSGPAEELRVLAALHSIGADLGEPIQLTRRGPSLLVSGAGLEPRRQEEVRASVAGIPGVEVRFDGPGSADPRPSLPPGEFADRALDASDAVMARAHALRSLAVRFPPAAESLLSAADRAVLAGIRRDHFAALEPAVRNLEQVLAPLAAGGGAGEAADGPEWQTRAHALLAAAREVDRLLNTMLAGTGGGDTAELRSAVARLDAELAAYARMEGL